MKNIFSKIHYFYYVHAKKRIPKLFLRLFFTYFDRFKVIVEKKTEDHYLSFNAKNNANFNICAIAFFAPRCMRGGYDDFSYYAEQCVIARNYGLYGFCISDSQFKNSMIDYLIQNKNVDISFCLNMMCAKNGFTDRIFCKILNDRRYIKINERPLIVIENICDCEKTINNIRKKCEIADCGNPFFIARKMSSNTICKLSYIDAYIDEFGEFCESGDAILEQMRRSNNGNKSVEKINCVSVAQSQINTKKRVESNNELLQNYRANLEKACFFATESGVESNIVFINSWNDCGQVVYLEENQVSGFAYLDATYNVLSKFERNVQILAKKSQKKYKKFDTAIILHLYFFELWYEIKENFKNLGEFDLYISLANNVSINMLQEILADYPEAHIFIVENRGRDILPFLHIFSKIKNLNYKYICKIHGKKSAHRADGDLWRKRIFESILGSKEKIKHIKSIFNAQKDVGLVMSKEIAQNINGHDVLNNRFSNDIFVSLHIRPESDFNFPAGSMFWFRPEALQKIEETIDENSDFPIEIGQVEGTIAHAVERSFCIIAERAGYKSIVFDE